MFMKENRVCKKIISDVAALWRGKGKEALYWVLTKKVLLKLVGWIFLVTGISSFEKYS